MTTVSLVLPSDGTTIDAADVNAPFNTIATVINGGIDSTNITDGGITPNELTSGAGSSWAEQSYTPALTNLTLGNGTLAATYVQIGKRVMGRITFIMGSTSVYGTLPTFALPVPASVGQFAQSPYIGLIRFIDNGVSEYFGGARIDSSTIISPIVFGSASAYVNASGTTGTVPFTWGVADALTLNFSYEAA